MTRVDIAAVRLDRELPLPAFARPGDAGLDLRASEAVTLEPGERRLVPTGLAVAIPEGHAGFVLPRSGLAMQKGVTVLNAPGLIDSGYRGELKFRTRAERLRDGIPVSEVVWRELEAVAAEQHVPFGLASELG